MPDLTLEQISHGCQADMRMRAHIDAGAKNEFGRAHLVEEYEWANHLRLCRRQRTPHLEAAEIARTRHDDVLDRVATLRVARNGI